MPQPCETFVMGQGPDAFLGRRVFAPRGPITALHSYPHSLSRALRRTPMSLSALLTPAWVQQSTGGYVNFTRTIRPWTWSESGHRNVLSPLRDRTRFR